MKKQFTFIHGDSGMGKTLYAKAMSLARVKEGGRLLVVDPNAVFGPAYGHAFGVAEIADRIRRAGSGPFALVARAGWDENLSDLFRVAFEAGRLLVVVDEAQQWASANGGKLDQNFLRLMQKGRNRFVDVATTSQAPKTLDPQVRGLWDVLVTFRQALPEHGEYIARTYLKRPGWAGHLAALPERNYVRCTVDGRSPVSRGVVGLLP